MHVAHCEMGSVSVETQRTKNQSQRRCVYIARRSKPHVTQFFNRDRLAFTALFKAGHVSPEQLYQCGLADSRISNLVRDGHFEKIAYKQSGHIRECYKLTKQGRETASHLWGLEQPYRAQSPAHDLALADKYFSLPEEIRETWSTESQIRDQFMEQLSVLRHQGKEVEALLYEKMLERGLISMPDACYVNDSGQTVAYETITNSYGEAELQAKEALVGIMNYQYETTRI